MGSNNVEQKDKLKGKEKPSRIIVFALLFAGVLLMIELMWQQHDDKSAASTSSQRILPSCSMTAPNEPETKTDIANENLSATDIIQRINAFFADSKVSSLAIDIKTSSFGYNVRPEPMMDRPPGRLEVREDRVWYVAPNYVRHELNLDTPSLPNSSSWEAEIKNPQGAQHYGSNDVRGQINEGSMPRSEVDRTLYSLQPLGVRSTDFALSAPSIQGTDTVLGRPVYVLTWHYNDADFKIIAWIDQSMYIPLKAEEYDGITQNLLIRTEATSISVNAPIPHSCFDFGTPQTELHQ